MDVQEVMYDGTSKFTWDGTEYDTKEDAEAKKNEYAGDGFEVRVVQQEDKHLVYTRRVVTEVVVEGEAPP